MLPKEKVQSLIDRHIKLEKELSAGAIEKKKYAADIIFKPLKISNFKEI